MNNKIPIFPLSNVIFFPETDLPLNLLNNSLKFVIANFVILWILNFNFISLPLLRQFSKVGFDLSIDLLKITIVIAVLSLLRKDRLSLIKALFQKRKDNSKKNEQEYKE